MTALYKLSTRQGNRSYLITLVYGQRMMIMFYLMWKWAALTALKYVSLSLYILCVKFLYYSDDVGWYRDDGLAVTHNANDLELYRPRKKTASFKNEALSVTIETNLVETDFLDVTFKLSTAKCYPYDKPNNAPLYIHAKSKHPPSIVKELPKLINKRISDLFFDESVFNNAKVNYKLALKHSVYKSKVKFDQQPSTRRIRNRKIIWFNPPFSQNVKANIRKLFFKLERKNFSKNHRFRKIFNLNPLRLSYIALNLVLIYTAW